MAYLLFIDESGQDRRNSPYEVLAGIAIEDKNLWNLISQVHNLEEKYFGKRYTVKEKELKAKKILKRKTFRLAKQLPLIPNEERRVLARECLEDGSNPTMRRLTALAQAKLEYVAAIFELINSFRCKIFATICCGEEKKTDEPNYLRKDYVYFFERFFYFLEDKIDEPSGIIVFDELEKTQCHILIHQIENYFKKTGNGRSRSNLIIPEPFFVQSDLTTGVQIADLIAYTISWGYRFKNLNKEARTELFPFVDLLKPMRYKTTREIGDIKDYTIWSIEAVDL